MKRSKKILMLSLLLVLFLSVSAISAADNNADITSSKSQNDESFLSVEADDNALADSMDSNIISSQKKNVLRDGEAQTMSLTDLKDKIYSSSTIVLDRDVAYDSTVDSVGGISIGWDVTINGNGHTIDGKSKTRIFQVGKGVTLTLKNINFVNGYMKGADGGVILSSGNLKVSNCNFTSCKVEGKGTAGGAIAGSGSGTISNCNFKKCSATFYGGAAHVNKVKFKNCNFYSNVAENGGAIGGTVYIYSCYFKNCKATSYASPVYDDNGGGACNGYIPYVEYSVFINCNAPRAYGGALRGTTNAYKCQFTDCTGKEGGGIGGKGSVIECTFKHCVANSEMGGAIFTEKATIKKCSFTDCSALKSNAGAIFVGNNVNIIGCKFTNCSAPNGYGGCVYGNGVISKCVFERNSAKYGGAVSCYSLIVKGSTFTANTATKGGAACDIKSLSSCTFNKNKATYGGAVCNAQNVVSSKFGNNYAKFGALSYNDVNVVFKKITVKNSVNLIQGLFYNHKHKLTVTASTIVNTGKFNRFFNFNTGTFIYKSNKLKSSVKMKVVAGPNPVKTR